MQGKIALLTARTTGWREAIGYQTAALSLSLPAGFKTFEPVYSLIQVGRDGKDCAPGNIAS
jgi:hypothetical protein